MTLIFSPYLQRMYKMDVMDTKKVLIGFSPLDKEESMDAKNHAQFIDFVLSVLNATLHNVVAITGDNAAVNLKSANLLNEKVNTCFFIGFASHRFNLAVQDLMMPYKEVMDKLHKLMKKLTNLILVAKFRRFTPVKAKISYPTRWSSV